MALTTVDIPAVKLTSSASMEQTSISVDNTAARRRTATTTPSDYPGSAAPIPAKNLTVPRKSPAKETQAINDTFVPSIGDVR